MQKLSHTFSLALIFAMQCAQGQNLPAMQECMQLADDAARLSCYDTAMGFSKSALREHAAGGKAVRAESRFGDDGRLHTETKTTLPRNLSAQVRTVTPLPAGMYRLTLDNGQVWDTTQADLALTFKANDAITLTRGLLGSYQVSLTGHNTSVSAQRKQ